MKRRSLLAGLATLPLVRRLPLPAQPRPVQSVQVCGVQFNRLDCNGVVVEPGRRITAQVCRPAEVRRAIPGFAPVEPAPEDEEVFFELLKESLLPPQMEPVVFHDVRPPDVVAFRDDLAERMLEE